MLKTYCSPIEILIYMGINRAAWQTKLKSGGHAVIDGPKNTGDNRPQHGTALRGASSRSAICCPSITAVSALLKLEQEGAITSNGVFPIIARPKPYRLRTGAGNSNVKRTTGNRRQDRGPLLIAFRGGYR